MLIDETRHDDLGAEGIVDVIWPLADGLFDFVERADGGNALARNRDRCRSRGVVLHRDDLLGTEYRDRRGFGYGAIPTACIRSDGLRDDVLEIRTTWHAHPMEGRPCGDELLEKNMFRTRT